METYALEQGSTVLDLMGRAQATNEPVAVFDDGSECLIAMRPQVFERILYDSDLLNRGDRHTLHL